MSSGRGNAARRVQPWVLRIVAVFTLTMSLPTLAGGTSTAAILGSTAPFSVSPLRATPVHELTPTVDPETETYPERLERIDSLTRPLLPTPKSLDSAETRCASGDFTTLSVVYDSIFESVYDVLPPSLRASARASRIAAHRDMSRLHISTLAVTEHPLTLGADDDDPALDYRDPISQLLVSNLLKIRDGRHAEAIPLGNITVIQAVETVWLYIFTTVLIPARLLVGSAPDLGSPFAGTDADGLAQFVTYNWLISAFVFSAEFAVKALLRATAKTVLDQCVARVTEEQRAQAGRPSDTVRFDIPIPPMVAEIADHLALADVETCTPIGSLTLGRLVRYVSEQAQENNPADAPPIRAETTRILGVMRGIRIHHNLIPLDPAEERSVGELGASLFGSLIPVFGGAPLDILLGIGHNLGHGADPWETVSLDELTVSKPITAAHYAYKLALHLIREVGNVIEPSILGDSPLRPTRLLVTVLGLPMTYGLVTAHHVIRSMCLRADDTSGSGLGAEANRRMATDSTPRPGTTRNRESPRPSASRRSERPRATSSIPHPEPPRFGIPGLN
ncbi:MULTISPECIES: hypothetical protein [Gordonia]|uniref:hypothetical protein n=1 Tax=Gordonia TaxID=2053 RepID=UPI001269313E|nr:MULTISPECIES: hypothetical protein [Gordonia]